MRLIAIFMLLSCSCFGQNKWILTPYQNSSSNNVSITLSNSSGLCTDYPASSLFIQFSKDSIHVQLFSPFDGSRSIMNSPDSIKHFWTGSYNFFNVKGLDSFFHCCMTKTNP